MPIKTKNYALVTPCKNEEWNLPNLIKSVMAQTIRPALWVIVDDGSTDKSAEILNQLEKKHEWVKVIHLKENKEYLGVHYSYVINEGFDYIKKQVKKNNINWEFIGILDADNIPEPEYFEKIINEFAENPKLGIASGATCELTENISHVLEDKSNKFDITNPEFWATYPFSLIKKNTGTALRTDLPMGSARLWRKECFIETGGRFENINGPDAISNIRAKIKGWETIRFPEIKVIERSAMSAQGNWYGYKDRGRTNYVYNLPLYVILLKALKYSSRKPHYKGIAYLYGYFGSLITKAEQIKDEEIRRYYRSVHLKETKKIKYGKN
jgi:glycosyltransferase involved in cell wall biosynthesis